MKQRLITAGIGIPILLGILAFSHRLGELPMLGLAFVIGNIINIEIWLMCRRKQAPYPFLLISILVLFSCSAIFLYGMGYIPLIYLFIVHSISLIFFFYVVILPILTKDFEFSYAFELLGVYFISYITLIICLPILILLKILLPSSIAFIIVFTFCWLSDFFALLIGSKWGHTTLTQLPSKSKTLEGYVGSLILTLLLGILYYFIQGILNFPFQWPLYKWALFGLTMSFMGGTGDLIESLIKRWANQKDSSNFLPGMGGYFDAIDAQIYVAPIALLFFLI